MEHVARYFEIAEFDRGLYFLDASAWTAIFMGCNRSDVGRKGDTGGGISRMKKERRSCDKRSKGI